MKIIQDDIRAVSSTNEQSAWPITNIQNEYPRNNWKASQHTQTDTAIKLSTYDYYGGSNALYLGNTNAKTGTLTVKSLDEVTTYETIDLSFVASSYFTWLTQRYLESFSESWVDYTYRSENLQLVLSLTTDVISDLTISSGGTGYIAGTLTATQNGSPVSGFFGTYTIDSSGTIDSVHIVDGGTGVLNSSTYPITIAPSDSGDSNATITGESTLNLGIARAGYAKSFENPIYGLKEGSIDYSIKKRFSTGAEFYKRRDIVRTFNGSLGSQVSDNETTLLQSILRQARQEAVAFNLLNGDNRGVLFGKITQLPSSSRTHLNRMSSNISIEELL